MNENKDNRSKEVALYQDICLSILKISDSIRYVGIINRFGRTITGKLKNGMKPILTPEQARDERYIESTRQYLRRSLEISTGKSLFTIEKNENVTFLLIPQITKDILYYITIEKDAELNEINEIINDIFIKIK
jgi:hypothetical protein